MGFYKLIIYAWALVLGICPVWGQFDYELDEVRVAPVGRFSVYEEAIHCWESGVGYVVYDLTSSAVTLSSWPDDLAVGGDVDLSFAVLDADTQRFYAGALNIAGDRFVGRYDAASNIWLPGVSTMSTVEIPEDAIISNGRMYLVSRGRVWNQVESSGHYIYLLDTTLDEATVADHDALIDTNNVSGMLAVDSRGHLYFASSNEGIIYRWTATQIESVIDDLSSAEAVDSFLTLDDAQQVLSISGTIDGLAVDSADELFFSANDSSGSGSCFLAIRDVEATEGYQVLVYSEDALDRFGDIAIDGAFENGAALYFSAREGGHLLKLSRPIYSLSLADDDNPYDAPIPGFVGPAGDGKVAITGFEDALNMQNYVNPLFLAWADEWTDYSPASIYHSNGVTYNVDPYWQYPEGTLGAVTGDNFDVAALGDLEQSAIDIGADPGSLTIRFADPVRNLSGADFAVFENAFVSQYSTSTGSVAGGVWGELAYVEASSNGIDFARFPSVSNTAEPVGAYGSLNAEDVFNLVGKHSNAYGESWGTPFDLSYLESDILVQDGSVDLNAITHIRVVDIPGNGSYLDSLGQAIYDAWVTWGSGGADIEAFGAISQELTYDAWRQGRSLPVNADSDGDGWTNFQEYAFRLDPELVDGAEAIRFIQIDAGEYEFSFPRDERNASVRYVLEGSVDLSDPSPENWECLLVIEPMLPPEIQEFTRVARVESFQIESTAAQASVGVLQVVRVCLLSSQSQAFFRIRLESVE